MVKKEIKALMIEPGKHPVVTVLNNDLDPNEFSLSNSIGENAIHELKFFVRSWLYKQIKVWNESETYHLNIETKKCLFSFEMGI